MRVRSQTMVDKIAVVERHKCGERIGALDPALLAQLDASLAFVIGLAEEPDQAGSAL